MLRLGLFITAAVGLLFLYLGERGSFIKSMVLDLDNYAVVSCLLAILMAHRTTRKRNYDNPPSELEIRRMRQAVIMNSVALTLNTIVMILQFLFIPITMISDGLLTFEYFLKYKTISFILSFGAILTHFVFIRFTMIKKDYQWIIATLGIWGFFNLTADSDGLFFSQMNGAKNLVKIAMAIYFIMASTCLFFVLC